MQHSFDAHSAAYPPASIDFRGSLNPDQYAAVTAPEGAALVLAGAGSGKTRTLTYRVAWLRSQGIPPWRLLLLTFTNKAAREMLGRVEEITGETVQIPWGGTFHSVGARFLRQHGSAIGLQPSYTILDEGDAESLVKEVINQKEPAFLKDKDNPKPKAIRDVISYARNTCTSLRTVIEERMSWAEERIPEILAFAEGYDQLKRSRQVTDYDDLLVLWLETLRKEEAVRRHYQEQFTHILVDEYQDTNLLQSEIIDLLAHRHQLMAVGDDAQCIYTWRGACFDNIANFSERHPGATIYRIEINYRSTPQILELANGILANRPTGVGFPKELRAIRPSAGLPYVVGLLDSRHQAQFLIRKIQSLSREGHSLSDIAILYRAHHHAVDTQIEFARAGIPFLITSGVRFFEQAHIRDLVAQLRFLANPRDASAFARVAVQLPRVGERTAQRLFAQIEKLYLKRLQQTAHGPDLFDNQSRGVENPEGPATPPICDLLLDSDILARVPNQAIEDWKAMAETWLDAETALRSPLPETMEDKDPSRPENIVRILVEGWYGDFLRTGSALANWESRRDDLDTLIAFAQRHADLSELLAQLVLLSTETGNRADEPDEDCVRLTTIHQAKGLEFPIVFVIGLADGQFPLKRAIDSGDLDEERRLFYVAVTRAMDELYLCYAKVHLGHGGYHPLEPSQFLADIPHEHYEHTRFDYT